ncbi:mannose-6-phosphate isomerase [Mycoplasma capricolum subsp. capripneumoniae]|uniref:Mannose-6-phosphate isomerase n=1 Tax=Mycoplasma capricolum subsp. capripneumoniae 87001 TaxID=1124992 RepID=A0A9N7G7H2_MYCCC|nr:type I phosphomannose isomerase catalytic subunit [Mycoplasma capricolum]AJK51514.1 mannose-6-phosphate isomerase [Mycoplasma capricolum subsp. capripneumoniae 87001]AOQ22175.1 mannose-6-phosphate isomerase [Mycoplasma capricolum subsp. capripneumoniae M1601]KEY84544.1 Mannose-6-phosphate isomerase [Mycoplasma capricolum subsp. capripneumoniae 99108]QDL19642.1 mannose-6-phosphate isomerase [Mycoplasma capricolum subsp. capripneumoniae]QDL20327.1 mannose-6-phosphate isomerase [Mycoplasma cap
MKILKLKPYFFKKVWGGNRLKDFGFDIKDNQNIGEAWVISAHENGMSYIISDDQYNNLSLKELFESHKELFNNYKGCYPLLVKIITASDYLSVQVHPDDNYALKNHNQLGKPESWYVIDANKDSELIYGHKARNKKELIDLVNQNKWDQLLKKVKVKANDFLYVAPGKVHAISSNLVIYELQRSSDITYRFYDYNRIDKATNKPRQLDISNSIECTTIPDTNELIICDANNKVFSSKYFSLYVLECTNLKEFEVDEKCDWLQLTVISGSGYINEIFFKQAESAITINGVEKLIVKGKIKIIISWIKNNE